MVLCLMVYKSVEYFCEFYDNAHNWEMSGTIPSQVHVCGASLRPSQIHEQSSVNTFPPPVKDIGWDEEAFTYTTYGQ